MNAWPLDSAPGIVATGSSVNSGEEEDSTDGPPNVTMFDSQGNTLSAPGCAGEKLTPSGTPSRSSLS